MNILLFQAKNGSNFVLVFGGLFISMNVQE